MTINVAFTNYIITTENSTYKPNNLIDTKIVFLENELIFIELNGQYKLAKIIEVYESKEHSKYTAKLLIINNADYRGLKVFPYTITETDNFFYADPRIIDGKTINLLNTYKDN